VNPVFPMKDRKPSVSRNRNNSAPPSKASLKAAQSNQAAQDELRNGGAPTAVWEHVTTDMIAKGPDDPRIPYDERGYLRDFRGPRKEDVVVNQYGAGATEMARSGTAPVYQEDSVSMWNVFFDHRSDGQTTDMGTWQEPQRNRDPLIMDLNRNGKHDTTAKTTFADGEITGPTTRFDLDPTRGTWEFSMRNALPGRGAPRIRGGSVKAIKGNQGMNDSEVAQELAGAGSQKLGGAGTWSPSGGVTHAVFFDAKGNKVGAWENGTYSWGARNEMEQTEWLEKGGGDGFLVWDVDGDGQITSGKELFSEFDIDGYERFANGFEKLAHYFDKDGDGVVEGEELVGLMIWVDEDADGKTDPGELRELKDYRITSLKTGFDPKTMESSFSELQHIGESRRRAYFGG
jgi:Ca2+-binding EF-hand superfamily protein